MKNATLAFGLVLVLSGTLVSGVYAQTKGNRSAGKKPGQAQANAAAATVPAAPPPAPAPPMDTAIKPVPEADLKIPVVKPSLRNEFAFDRNLVKDRQPLAYEHIREDDATFVQRVWREIDVHEKLNLAFSYKSDGEQGNQRFILMLLNAIKREDITAFDGTEDRFTTPITYKQIAENLVGKPKTIQKPDLVQDPDGSKGIMKDTTIVEEFDADLIERYWIKEDWIFDKESSRMHVRILGIAPLKTVLNSDGSFRDVTPIFWIYYPDLRPFLAKYEAYNGRNFGSRMSWEELFESRMFSSRIIKSTINNPNNLFIKSYIKDPMLALLEGENVREKIFNYEQELWQY